jgi:hypothetical protein
MNTSETRSLRTRTKASARSEFRKTSERPGDFEKSKRVVATSQQTETYDVGGVKSRRPGTSMESRGTRQFYESVDLDGNCALASVAARGEIALSAETVNQKC